MSDIKLKKQIYVIYLGIIGVWIMVWMIKEYVVDPNIIWVTTNLGSFIWWTIAKFLVWILPSYYLIRISGRKLYEVFNFSNWKKILLWGGGIGFIVAITGFIPKYISGQDFFPSELSFSILNVLIVAPIFEEFFIRGAILGSLSKIYSFKLANIIASLMFVILHLPGWYFMGSLVENIVNSIGGALSIFILGLLFGYAVQKSKSVMGGILAHFLNNLSSLH